MSTPPPPPQSKILAPRLAHDLAIGNLLRIFAERSPSKRQSAISTIYTPDATIHEPGSIALHSHTAIDRTVDKLLAEREGWDFIPLSPVRLNHDFVYVAWGFGPRSSGVFGSGEKGGVEVKVTGSDHILVDVESGLVKTLYVVIDEMADVKI